MSHLPHRRRPALLALTVLLAAGLAGCGSLRRDPEPSAPPPSTPLERADSSYAAGDHAAAAELYREALANRAGQRTVDRILFRLGVIHLLPDSPERDRESGRSYLDRLASQHPASPWGEPARLLLTLDERIEQLETRTRGQRQTIEELEGRLEALKRIDLEHSSEPPRR